MKRFISEVVGGAIAGVGFVLLVGIAAGVASIAWSTASWSWDYFSF